MRRHGSIAAQRVKLEALATLNDYQLIDVVVDAGASAKSLDRPGWQRVMGAVHGRQVGAVLIAKLDRCTRSVADLASRPSSSTAAPASHGRRLPTSSAPPGTAPVPAASGRARAPTRCTGRANVTTKRQRRAPGAQARRRHVTPDVARQLRVITA